MNWRIKVYIQFVLAHIPAGEKVNFLLQKKSGRLKVNNAEIRIDKVIKIFDFIRPHTNFRDATVVEIGTGWMPLNTLCLYLSGAKEIHTYDHVPHLRFEIARNTVSALKNDIPRIAAALKIPASEIELKLNTLEAATDLSDFLKRANIHYHAPADARHTGLPDKSVDLVYSYAVLEHVKEEMIGALSLESKRILKQGGVAYHNIGLHDHYISVDKTVSKVNFLKCSELWWKIFVKNKISYHNRLRERDFIETFQSAGATIVAKKNRLDPKDLELIKQMKVNKHFSRFTPEELAVSSTEMVLSY